MDYTKNDEIRFWSKVKVTNKRSCWYWSASKHHFGYGWFRINKKTHSAHRLALIFYNGGKIEDGKLVLHNCNNPGCCNPNHLRWGSQKENIQDCIAAGRKTDPPRGNKPPIIFGEKNSNAVMTYEKVKELRELWSKKKTRANDLAKMFDISISTVYQIAAYKTWKPQA
jgi:hypothetical protein